MTTAFDVATYILEKRGSMTAMKLQKLVYYAQAWSLVWDERPLFAEPIQAWMNGPVVPELYRVHAGQFQVDASTFSNQGAASRLTHDQIETIDAVLEHYGAKTAQALSDLTHAEAPWLAARVGLAATDRGEREITVASMHEYYSGLVG